MTSSAELSSYFSAYNSSYPSDSNESSSVSDGSKSTSENSRSGREAESGEDIEITVAQVVKRIDENFWKMFVDLSSHNMCVDDEPYCDVKIQREMTQQGLSLPREGSEGVTFLTIPKGSSLNKLKGIGESPVMGENTCLFRDLSPELFEEYGDIEVEQTYTIVHTNNILKETRNQKVPENVILAKTLGCDLPEIIETMALCVMTYMIEGVHLFSDDRNNYTQCKTEVHGCGEIKLQNCYPIIGGYLPKKGLRVDATPHYADAFGAAGVIRLDQKV